MMSQLQKRQLERQKALQDAAQKAEKPPVAAAAEANPAPRISPLKALREKRQQPPAVQDLKHWQAFVDKQLAAMRGLDIDAKAGIKAQAVAGLKPFINDYLQQQRNYPNSVAVWFALWLWDLGDIENAVNLSLHLVAQEQRTPPEFDSDLPTVICDQIYDWANTKLQKDEGAAPYLPAVIEAMEAGKWVVHEIPKGKVYAMAAKHADAAGDSPAAVKYAETALAINERAGVKKILEKHQALIAQA